MSENQAAAILCVLMFVVCAVVDAVRYRRWKRTRALNDRRET